MPFPRSLVRARGRLRLAALLFAALSGCGGSTPTDGGRRPNVILIVIDTLRADVLLDDDRDMVKTPNIDALAAEGTVFPEAFCHAPMTLPSHTSLFSSRLPYETGVVNNGMAVGQDLPLLAQRLGESGYDTRGVISLGTLRAHKDGGLDRGFERYDMDVQWLSQAPVIVEKLNGVLDELASPDPLFLFAHFSDPHEPYNAHGAARRSATIALDGEELATVTTSEMTEWAREIVLPPGQHEIEVRSPDPFILRRFYVIRGDGVKTEWDSKAKGGKLTSAALSIENTASVPASAELGIWINDWVDRPDIARRYMGEVEFVDRYVGELLDSLRRRGLYDDSIVIFTADHGEGLGEHGNVGHVQNLYDELIHVPLLIKLPKGDPRQAELERRRSNLVAQVDLAPTLLHLLGLPALPGQQGHSILDDGERAVISETHKPEATRNLISIRDLDYKMIIDADSMQLEMYDMRKDPRELENAYASLEQQRPQWPALLRGVAAAGAGIQRGELDPETKARLDALGY